MKVAIMTWSKHKGYLNYGTALQVCALSSYIKRLGHSCQVIDYEPRRYGKCYESMLSLIKGKASSFFYKTNMNNSERVDFFADFFHKNVEFTKKCNTLPELEDLNKAFDCFICGSDQIWALFDPHFFLDFVKDNTKKISYAPSVGMADIKNEIQKEKIKELASSFNRLSTREKIGSELISKLTGKSVETVLDPTLLFTSADWVQVCDVTKKNSEQYILVYFLGHNLSYWKTVYRISKKLRMPVKIIPVYTEDYKRLGCLKTTVGPNEFVSLIANSSLVLTDSFHGVSFSINFNKNFYAFKRFCDDNSFQNNRIYEILSNLDLMNRIYVRTSDFSHQDIDYDSVEKKLCNLRTKSIRFLEEALSDTESSNNVLSHNDVKSFHGTCCGCGACVEVCPRKALSMIQTEEGFWESVIDYDKCINCGKCLMICPLHNSSGIDYSDSSIYSFKSADMKTLQRSSSGGAAFSLANTLLKKGYSIAGCTYNKRDSVAEHSLVEDSEGLKAFQGSKYLQSNFANVLNRAREKEKVAFFGTPCQIAGAKRLYGDNAYYIDLICHGVPSYNLFKKYLLYVENRYGLNTNDLAVIFRDKTMGWRERFIRLSDSNKTVVINQNNDLFYLMFEHSLCFGKQCFECPWRDKSEADIRVGDFWGDEFITDKTGVSILFAFSDKGKSLATMLREYGEIEERNDINFRSFQQTKNAIEPLDRGTVIQLLADDKVGLAEIVRKYVKPKERQRQLILIGSKIIKQFGKRSYDKREI